jgi:Uma2 family endonuclease
MSPLARHERPHRIIADIVKVLLDKQNRDWEDFGATILKRPSIAGVEPDTCIQNVPSVQGCIDLNLDNYPPPDLAIESDVTSLTAVSAYQAMAVPEIWVYRQSTLKIHLLTDSGYIETNQSQIFPDLAISTLIPQLVQQAISILERSANALGTSKMLRELRSN